jgi:hypothetical protein
MSLVKGISSEHLSPYHEYDPGHCDGDGEELAEDTGEHDILQPDLSSQTGYMSSEHNIGRKHDVRHEVLANR